MMKNWHRRILAFLAEPEAAVASEYALLIGLIAMVIFGAVGLFGSTVYNSLYRTSIAVLPFGS
ncbi:MAG: Flp family type IVb pilin [Desulfobaccales bacterium]